MKPSKIQNLDSVCNMRQILKVLDNEPMDKRGLTNDLDLSRTTIDRHIRDLEEEGLVHKLSRNFQLTTKGRLTYREFVTMIESIEKINEIGVALNTIPKRFSLEPKLIRTGTVITPDKYDVEKPVRSLETKIKNTNHIRSFSDHIIPRFNDIYDNRMSEDKLRIDAILEKNLVNYLKSEYGEDFLSALERDELNLFFTGRDIPVGLMIFDQDEIAIIIHENHNVRAIINNSTNYGIKWAESIYSDQLEKAEKVTSEEPEL